MITSKIKLLLLTVIIIGCGQSVNAQVYNPDAQQRIQNEIDNQLWKPFRAAFETNDAIALNALYAEEVIRVTPAGLDISSHFKKANLKRFEATKASGSTTDLDFWFEHRHSLDQASYEVGYFRITSQSGNETNVIYGQFHIFLKKIDGEWKITQDWDNSFVRGAKVSEADFKRGKKGPFND